MNDRALARTPAWSAVAAEQLRAVGLAVRREAIGAALLVALPTLALAVVIALPATQALLDDDLAGEIVLDPADGWGGLVAMAALLLPLVVWKGEQLFADSELWTLPAEHGKHALVKIAAGWAWLMGFVALAMLFWGLAITLLMGGTVGADETRLVVMNAAAAATGDPGGTASIYWTTPWWQWITPFTAATAAYLIGSALLLGTEHPWRWAIGGWIAFLAVFGIADEANIRLLQGAYEVVSGSAEMVLLGEAEDYTWVTLPSGDRSIALESLPSLGAWVAATAAWIAVGSLALAAAWARRRER